MADLVNVAPGQCRLVVTSSSLLTLNRHQGAYIPLKIAGNWEAKLIPSTAPTLSNSGLTAATLYYIYAFDNAGTLELEASATGHSPDPDTGVEIQTGDDTRTLVGMVFMDAGTPGTFVDSTGKRWCLNWFNRRVLDLTGTFSTDRATSSTSFVEINTEIRMQYLSWADEAVVAGGSGTAIQNTGGNAVGSALGFDSTTIVAGVGFTGAGTHNAWAIFATKTVSEGSHYITLLGAVSAGTGTWDSADSIGTGPMKSRIFAAIRG